jgi:hypothetical protein
VKNNCTENVLINPSADVNASRSEYSIYETCTDEERQLLTQSLFPETSRVIENEIFEGKHSIIFNMVD